MSSIKNNSEWKNINGVFVKVAGQWKTVTQSYIKVNGQWRLTTFSTGPTAAPQMTHDGFGRFRVVNYDPSLIYEAQYISGNVGSVSFSNGVFTLGSTRVAYNVVSRFVPNGPPSPQGYMERRPIEFTFIAQCVYNSRTCFNEINEDYPASFRDDPKTYVGNTSSCAPYSCGGFAGPLGPDGSNRCICFDPGINPLPDFVVGGGLCPGGYYICNGNRCCLNYTERVYFCPSGGSLSGTTCIRRRQEPYECGFWTSCNNENPVPAGYNRSPGTANVQGEWWRTTR
jgi:hypothetical protein